MSSVIIYTTPICPYCKMAKEYFQKHNIGYNEIDVAADPKKAQEMVEKTGHFGVPVIDIDGQIIFGFNQAQIEKALGYKK